jgi:SAM-dependent methyltransferase
MEHPDLADMLDLDADVLHQHHHDVIAWAASMITGPAAGPPRIIDLGAGTGTAALALARQRPDAQVIAVDVSGPMLEKIRHKAAALGVADRVATVEADLVWAANSLHHVADPGRVLAQAFTTLRPGGALVVAEVDSFPRFLPDDAGAALEERGHAAMAEIRAEAGMHMDEDWGVRLAGAGLRVRAQRHFDIVLRPPLPAAAGRYAQVSLQHIRHGLDGRLSPADLADLDAAAAAAPGRRDLVVRASRTAWLARRP